LLVAGRDDLELLIDWAGTPEVAIVEDFGEWLAPVQASFLGTRTLVDPAMDFRLNRSVCPISAGIDGSPVRDGWLLGSIHAHLAWRFEVSQGIWCAAQ